ncbi:hypothetical protein K6119_09565 [Paracrocinitomix mangrovi]|uniref:hypothetical protein n=1 Tax=Paracrocinitomix mangrovi TaxID=2862509 RepID=UPI001C8E9545|nr:hypothetical protein [Paracrocinitomix mangrovi]UKN03738.1 hypothetical protein K6119_09565 [Paracrocinitomix mangrovi]
MKINNQKLFLGFTKLGAILMAISYMFRIMHWPNAGIMMLSAYLLISIFLPASILRKKKKFTYDVLTGLGAILYGGFGIISILHKHELIYHSLERIGLVVLLSSYLFPYIIDKNTIPNRYFRTFQTLYISGTLIFTIGIFFKTMHFPYAKIPFYSGLVSLVLIFLLTFFIDQKPKDNEILDDL